jgi:hypothetical protein
MEPEPEQAEPEIQDSPPVEAEVAVTELLAQPGSILTGEETQAAETAFSNGLFSVAWWKVRPYAVFWAAAGFLIFIAVAAGLMNSGKSHNRVRKEILPARFLQNGDSSAVITCPACDVTLMVPAKALAAHEGVPHRLASGVNPMPYFDVCCSHGNDHSWMSRAIFAERNAVRTEDIVKQGLIPDVARWMKDSFLKKLLFQRAALQKTQEMSTEQVAKLEERLSKINENFRSKLDHYEGRISELERDNNVKDELNRKLMRAKILSAEAAKRAQSAKPSPAEDEKDTKSCQFPSHYPPST